MSDEPRYRCTTCGVIWSYRAVRHTARCRDCGRGLARVAPVVDARTPAPRRTDEFAMGAASKLS
jgi:DNA-directed RNA polymerase subunit RPC12/RpoP